MAIIKLIGSFTVKFAGNFCTNVWVETNKIKYLKAMNSGGSEINFIDKTLLYVKETPEEILALIKEAKNEN